MALLLTVMRILVLARLESTPLLADQDSQLADPLTCQFIAAVPAFVSRYEIVPGINGPPAYPLEFKPASGLTAVTPD